MKDRLFKNLWDSWVLDYAGQCLEKNIESNKLRCIDIYIPIIVIKDGNNSLIETTHFIVVFDLIWDTSRSNMDDVDGW